MSLTSDDQGYHDLISTYVSAKWMSDSKSAPQITLVSITAKKNMKSEKFCVFLLCRRTRLDSFLIPTPTYDFYPQNRNFILRSFGAIGLR